MEGMKCRVLYLNVLGITPYIQSQPQPVPLAQQWRKDTNFQSSALIRDIVQVLSYLPQCALCLRQVLTQQLLCSLNWILQHNICLEIEESI